MCRYRSPWGRRDHTFVHRTFVSSNSRIRSPAVVAKELHPLKPLGQGHALAHSSSARHAGAATVQGVRDILVIFLAATEKNTSHSAPRWERAARMKSTAREYCSKCSSNIHEQVLCRVLHHRLAIHQVFDDGEAWHYLAMALLDLHDNIQLDSNNSNNLTPLELAVSCLGEATMYTPCDGRLYNNLGITLERLLAYYNDDPIQSKVTDRRIRSAYRNSIMIHSTCRNLGCDVGSDYESACLNFGLYLSKGDEFDQAIDVLSRIALPTEQANDLDTAERVIRDASSLLAFCKRQCD